METPSVLEQINALLANAKPSDIQGIPVLEKIKSDMLEKEMKDHQKLEQNKHFTSVVSAFGFNLRTVTTWTDFAKSYLKMNGFSVVKGKKRKARVIEMTVEQIATAKKILGDGKTKPTKELLKKVSLETDVGIPTVKRILGIEKQIGSDKKTFAWKSQVK